MSSRGRRRRQKQQRQQAERRDPPLTLNQQLGLPNPHRRARSVKGFAVRGVTPIDDTLYEQGSAYAVVYARERNISQTVSPVLNEAQRRGLMLYCLGKTAGRPSMSQWDGIPAEKSSLSREVTPEPVVHYAIRCAQYFEAKMTIQNQYMAEGVWRALFPQEDLPRIQLEGLAYYFTKSEDIHQKIGAIKTVVSLVSSEMGDLLDKVWRAQPIPEGLERQINKLAGELFSL